MTWFDSHCHLHLCDGDPGEVITRSSAAGVDRMLTAGTEIESSRLALELASNDGVHAAVGVHPNDCSGFSDRDAALLDEMLDDRRAVAVGESGLDFYRHETDHRSQHRAFDVHIDLAKKHGKALVVHTRESVGAALDQLERAGPPDLLVFHCWSGTAGDLHRALDLGSFVSFAGNVSFKSANDLREAAALVPDDRLLVETDSPFLTPEPHRGKRNEPRNVVHVGEVLAAVRGASLPDVARLTSRNAERLFGLK